MFFSRQLSSAYIYKSEFAIIRTSSVSQNLVSKQIFPKEQILGKDFLTDPDQSGTHSVWFVMPSLAALY